MSDGARPDGLLRRLRKGAQNALELLREGRLGAPYHAPYDVVFEASTHALRHYRAEATDDDARHRQPVLFVPPLMVTSEVYDISPELSATSFLGAHGVDVWLIDFGTPEDIDGGLDRTLDDHILAISDSVARVAVATGQRVHLLGYSQGGMFAYQAAAYRACADVASVVTFGAPVDLRRNLPGKVHETLAERLIDVARAAIKRPLASLDGLPGTLSSRGFKLMSPSQEVKYLVRTLGLLHDRDALVAREPARRFLGGEGFIAWPGPAFRKFVDEFIVKNRLARGGFVIGGRTVSLAAIDVPVLYFVGTRDDFARPASVAAIEAAAPNAELHRVDVDAGHFGLVVGSRAMTVSWPAVEAWVAWVDGAAEAPPFVSDPEAAPASVALDDAAAGDTDAGGVQQLYDAATDVVDGLWTRLGGVGVEMASVVSAMRWQLPRLARIQSMKPWSRVSVSQVLAEQAAAIGEQPFFVYEGRAFTYAAANQQVTDVAGRLAAAGVRRGHHVAVLMASHPNYLVVVAAINRLGATSALLSAFPTIAALEAALSAAESDWLVADAAHLDAAVAAFADVRVLLMGGAAAAQRPDLPAGVRDLDALASVGGGGARDVDAEHGRASDVATLMVSAADAGPPSVETVTNGRWIAAGLSAAAACELTPRDTVYGCLPLSRERGLLDAVGGAVVGGARLALAAGFDAARFWPDVRNAGATVVFYDRTVLRGLLDAPASALDSQHPVRLFAGRGLDESERAALSTRFGGVDVLALAPD